MGMKFANNAATTLSGAIGNAATSLSVVSSATFPTLGGGDYFFATIRNNIGNIEIIKVTSLSGSNWTVIVRNIDASLAGPPAGGWVSGDVVELRMTKGSLDLFPKLDETNTFTGINIFSTGINSTPIGAGGASTGSFTTLSTSGTLTVGGNLVVNGTTTTVNTTNLDITDANITLAKGNTSDATLASSNAGLTLDATSPKTIIYTGAGATGAFTSSEHISVATGKSYQINGTSVLNSTTLGSGVVSSSLTGLGTVTTGVWNAAIVPVLYGGTGSSSSTGSGSVVLATSPTFTGTPAGPTASVDTNTTQIATTAYVIGQAYLKSSAAASTYQPIDTTLTSLAAFNSNGIIVQTALDTFASRTLTGTSNDIVITDGNGVSGAPTFATGSNIPKINGTNTFTALNTFSLVAATGLTNDINSNLFFGTASLATSATNGFPYFPTCAGTPTGVPTANTGRSPVIWDSTGNKLWIYSGGIWNGSGGGTGNTGAVANTLAQRDSNADLYANNFVSSSDIRLKTNILPITNSLSKVNALNGKYFSFKTTPDIVQMGLIAQEVMPIVPEVVVSNSETLSVNYPALVALLIESIKELTTRVNILEGN